MLNTLWTEKWRPGSIDGYVFKDAAQKAQILEWINNQSIPNLIFSGGAGTGKTTLAKILINELHVNPFDVMEINASRENSVDNMRERITAFVSTLAFGDFKVVLLDEADFLSIASQAILRGLMEQYASGARFILTCNYPHKIIPALHSRCQGFHVEKLDQTEFTARVAEILLGESVEFNIDSLDTFVKTAYPDLRKCINLCQQHTIGQVLTMQSSVASSSSDAKLDAVALFKAGRIREGRQLILNQFRPDEMNDLITWSYNNLALWGSTDEQRDAAILAIRKAAVNVSLVADQEINAAAMFVELAQINNS